VSRSAMYATTATRAGLQQDSGGAASPVGACRGCGHLELRPFLDLGETPIANALVDPRSAPAVDPRFPLAVAFCPRCSLVQLAFELPAEAIFTGDYPYHSSYSELVRMHGERHVQSLYRTRQLGRSSLVVEIGSNDGYLLAPLLDEHIPVLGIDPAPGPAAVAVERGVPTLVDFFGSRLAAELASERKADVIIANNVLAHVPDLNDVMEGIATLLAPDGVCTIENPYVGSLIDELQFDTIYHEHYCYFSCTAIAHVAERHGLALNHVEHFPELHGGTLRWTLAHGEARTPSANWWIGREAQVGLLDSGYYSGFGERVVGLLERLRATIDDAVARGKRLAAYGAAAKGATLLNVIGEPANAIRFVADRNPVKQGKLMPGVRTPILPPEALLGDMPDLVLLLVWNATHEVLAQQAEYRARGGRWLLPVPEPQII
jgi:SAM-dependent methyltransferase